MDYPPEKNSILIVDDDVVGRTLLKKALEAYECTLAEDGFAALKATNISIPDLILLDVNMPGMDGFQVCKKLKQSPVTAEIPIIFITGLSQTSDISRGFQEGAVDFITKPFEISEVRARVKTHISLKISQESLRQKNSQLQQIIKEQKISSDLAHKVLTLINPTPFRYIPLANDLSLFVNIFSQPCYDEGGDHCLIRTLPASEERPERTVISIKDQSGHSVNCILRSIVTDLIHNSILQNNPQAAIEDSLSLLNNAILEADHFEDDDFLTSLTAEINHFDLSFRYVSAGHPSFILIRNGQAQHLPLKNSIATNLPIGFQENISYNGDTLQLQEGDQIILYTDGLTDMPLMNTGESLSGKALIAMLQEVFTHKPATIHSTMNLLLDKIKTLSTINDTDQNHFSDDITVIGIEIEGNFCKEEIVLTNITDIDQQITDSLEIILRHCKDNNALVDEFNLLTAFSELVLNAWKHGNKKDPSKAITIRWWLSNDLNIEITDQGEGFNYSPEENPRKRANVSQENGRGIFLVRKLSDSARWFDGGNRAIVSFRINECSWGQQPQKTTASSFKLW